MCIAQAQKIVSDKSISSLSPIPNECVLLKPVSEDIFTQKKTTVKRFFSYYGRKSLRNASVVSRTVITQTAAD